MQMESRRSRRYWKREFLIALLLALVSSGRAGDSDGSHLSEGSMSALNSTSRRLQGGYAALETTERIVGGRPVMDGKYPYFGITASTLLCGATLFQPDMLLSAGHCKGAFSVGAFVGGIRLDGEGSLFAEVEEEIVHPHYDRETFLNDIMIIKLRDPLPLPLVRLNFRDDVPAVADYVSVVGFGEVFGRSGFSQELLEVTVPVLEHKKCSRHFKSAIDTRTMLCAGGEKGRDSCTGDSGGPLLSNREQIGIVSYGDGCAQAGVPAVYTRVSAFRSWIEETVCKKSSSPTSDCGGKQTGSVDNESQEWNNIVASFHETDEAETAPGQDVNETVHPTGSPSKQPSVAPTLSPSDMASFTPSSTPSAYPTGTPSFVPTSPPSKMPTTVPTARPTSMLTTEPSPIPTVGPTETPTDIPTPYPSYLPSPYPSPSPTGKPFPPAPSPGKRPNRPMTAISMQQFMHAADEFVDSPGQLSKTPFSTLAQSAPKTQHPVSTSPPSSTPISENEHAYTSFVSSFIDEATNNFTSASQRPSTSRRMSPKMKAGTKRKMQKRNRRYGVRAMENRNPA